MMCFHKWSRWFPVSSATDTEMVKVCKKCFYIRGNKPLTVRFTKVETIKDIIEQVKKDLNETTDRKVSGLVIPRKTL